MEIVSEANGDTARNLFVTTGTAGSSKPFTTKLLHAPALTIKRREWSFGSPPYSV
jgi:hypothetical protein